MATRPRRQIAHWWVNLPIRYKGLLVIALPIIGIVVTVLVRIPFTEQQQTTTALLARSEEMHDRAREMQLALLEAENSANAFVWTSDRTFVARFHDATERFHPALERLGALARGGSEHQLYERLSQHTRRRLLVASEVVALAEKDASVRFGELSMHVLEGQAAVNASNAALAELLTIQREQVQQSQADLERIRGRLAPIIWITFFGGFAGALAAMWLFATGIARRMAAVERNAERLAQGVPLRREMSRGRDEIGRLDRALRRAGIMIRMRDRELRSLNTSLERSLHEQQILNKELEAFSYSVSHDLRAPLRSIDGFAQALREDWGDRLDETGQDHLSRVRNAAQRMGRLIDDLLKLSRLSRMQVQRLDVNLGQIARDIARELEERNPMRKVEWIIDDDLRANCDPSLARIVLENLLGNAWKFTSKTPDARIEFTKMRDTDPPTFVIRDNGAGFDMQYADKLFAPFQRLHGEREFPGTGIGLATVQRIVHKHGGEVWTRAEVGHGAAFYFSFEPADGAAAA
jgi:signal transduction histidine kinase